jgi:hypothetical protein
VDLTVSLPEVNESNERTANFLTSSGCHWEVRNRRFKPFNTFKPFRSWKALRPQKIISLLPLTLTLS